MKIHFLNADGLTALKTNFKSNIGYYRQSTNEWIFEYFQGDDPFGEFTTEVEDFKLMGYNKS